MPSVAMRRSTRVFVPKNGEPGKVLRSGRRILVESGEGKHGRRKGAQSSHFYEIHGGAGRGRVKTKQDVGDGGKGAALAQDSKGGVSSEKDIGIEVNEKDDEQGVEDCKMSNGQGRLRLGDDVEVAGTGNRGRKVNCERDVEVIEVSDEQHHDNRRKKATCEPDVEVNGQYPDNSRKKATCELDVEVSKMSNGQQRPSLEHDIDVTGTGNQRRKITCEPGVEITTMSDGHGIKVTRSSNRRRKATCEPDVDVHDIKVNGTGNRRRKATCEPDVEVTKMSDGHNIKVTRTSNQRRKITSEPDVEVTKISDGHDIKVTSSSNRRRKAACEPNVEVTKMSDGHDIKVTRTSSRRRQATCEPDVEVIKMSNGHDIEVTGTGNRRRKATCEPDVEVTKISDGHDIKVTGTSNRRRKVTCEPDVEFIKMSNGHDIEVTGTGNRRRKTTCELDVEVTKMSNGQQRLSLEHDIKVTGIGNRLRKATCEPDIKVSKASNRQQRLTSGDVNIVANTGNRRRKVTLEQNIKVTQNSNRQRKKTSTRVINVSNKSNGQGKVESEQEIETNMDSVDNMFGVHERKKYPQLAKDVMHGMFYVRKKLRKSDVTLYSVVDSGCGEKYGSKVEILRRKRTFISVTSEILDVIVEPSHNSSLRFTRFLVSVLKFMRSSHAPLSRVAALVRSEPIYEVFSRHGVHFMPSLSLGTPLVNDIISSGFCRIFGDQPFKPLVWLDFPAAPLFFKNLYAVIFLRSLYESHALPCFPINLLHITRGIVEGKTVSCHPSIRSSFDVDGFVLARRGISTRSAASQRFQKKKSSLRSKRMKKSSTGCFDGIQHLKAKDKFKANNCGKRVLGSLGVDMVKNMDGGYHASPTLTSNANATVEVKRDLCNNYGEVKPTGVELKDGLDSLSCNANILVIGSDRCFREEGATVSVECSTSKIWHVVVKAQGLTKYTHRIHDVIRPSTTNRFTRAVIWTSKDGWKLEFCDRKDWFVFKKLYKECWDKNLEVGSTTVIPVPGVREVLNYDDGNHVLFSRPDSYITVRDDEVTRALKKKVIYDIDPDDEDWLEKLNNGLCNGGIASSECLSADKFEKLIDTLEKAAYHNLGDVSDVDKLTTFCSELAEDKITTSVYQYWLNKRKQKRAAFLKVFECQPSSSQAPVEEEKFLNKRRSFKKQPWLWNQKKTRRKLRRSS